MNCAVHMEVEAAGYCQNCGKALCAPCKREVRGSRDGCAAGNPNGSSGPLRHKPLARICAGMGARLGGGLQRRVHEGAGSRGDFRGTRHGECARGRSATLGTHPCGLHLLHAGRSIHCGARSHQETAGAVFGRTSRSARADWPNSLDRAGSPVSARQSSRPAL